MKRLLVLLLLCACAVAALPGCKEIPEPVQQPLPKAPSLMEQWKQEMVPEGADIVFEAQQFAGHVSFSAWYSIAVTLRDGELCLSGKPYEQVEYYVNLGLELNENVLSVWKNTDRETAAEILTKIQNSPGFLLESKEADRTAPKVAVCEVDGMTYFLFTADSDSNEVMRIYCANRTA